MLILSDVESDIYFDESGMCCISQHNTRNGFQTVMFSPSRAKTIANILLRMVEGSSDEKITPKEE